MVRFFNDSEYLFIFSLLYELYDRSFNALLCIRLQETANIEKEDSVGLSNFVEFYESLSVSNFVQFFYLIIIPPPMQIIDNND